MRLNILLAAGIILGLIGASLLVAFGLWYVKPYMEVRDLVSVECTTENSSFSDGFYPCSCDGSKSCLSKMPCLKILVNFSGKDNTRHENVTLYDSYDTFKLYDPTIQCSYHRCVRSIKDNVLSVEQFARRYGSPGSEVRCYYRPSEPHYAVLNVISTREVVHCLFWPALAVVSGLCMLACHLIIDEARAKRKTRQYNSLERPWLRNVELNYENAESDSGDGRV